MRSGSKLNHRGEPAPDVGGPTFTTTESQRAMASLPPEHVARGSDTGLKLADFTRLCPLPLHAAPHISTPLSICPLFSGG